MRRSAGFAGLAATASTAAPALSKEVQGFVVPSAPVVAITHVRVIDGHGTPARENQTVLLRDGRIAAVGPAVVPPAGSAVIDGSGQTRNVPWMGPADERVKGRWDDARKGQRQDPALWSLTPGEVFSAIEAKSA